MFDDLIHADWSIAPGKRWMATAKRQGRGWIVAGPTKVDVFDLLTKLKPISTSRRVLAGFDFPIGVPAAYGTRTGLADFKALLDAIGNGDWNRFFDVAEQSAEIRIKRPFYPKSATKGVRRAELVAGLGCNSFDDLLRVCERKTMDGPEASSLFWTLGGKQVGKAALTGWKEVIKPALAHGAKLWPFDATLAELSGKPGVVLAETYPAIAYSIVGAAFGPRESKRRQADRLTKVGAICAWADTRHVTLDAGADKTLRDGFGSHADGEDRFDATVGLLKMIEIVDSHHPERTVTSSKQFDWEGWILGR